ncbi:IclR family transcriptional regulator C-terminal domain-containing protein [Variovorax sp. OV084]|jgi:IclR family pca regulon transcriptional regulator|uniref:IclR family transcriptional regulator domain-containing protein n=1 Tax=Variovorax TaxID=34072 RepID=UPI0008D4DBF9|nr:IclR family transcriptional regulator C-terminal domain-containing protein [Variovorax sp. OV084]SEU04121.1 transcriptional regulator, IclR family [Variovorax sp. OV084]
MRKNQASSPSEEATPDKNFVASLQKGLDVLTCFGRQHSRLTVSEVARLTQSSPASARRALLTLQTLGYLDSDGKRFWMLPKTLLVAHAYLASRPAPSLAQPLLDALSERTRESASLAMLQGDDAIIIARSTARRSLSTGLGIGSRLPAYCAALGRVLLAGLPPDEAARRVHAMPRPRLSPRTVTDADEVLALVAHCRKEGYATNDGELELDVRSMAVPVFDRSGQVMAAMSIAVRAERMTLAEVRETFLPALRKAAGSLFKRLHVGWDATRGI